MTVEQMCLEAFAINTDWKFVASLTLMFSLDLSSLILMILVFQFVILRKVLHVNLKIFLTNLTLFLFVRNSLTCFRAGAILAKNLFLKTSPCIFVADALACRYSSEIDKIPIELIIYGYVLVSIERLLATIYYTSYEKLRHYYFSLLAILLTWIYPIIHLIYVFNDDKIATTMVPYCSSLTSNSIDFLSMIAVKTPICVFCTFLNLLTLWVAARNKKAAAQNGYEHVSGRYQLQESVKFTRMIAISGLICHLLVIINVYSLVIIVNKKFESYTTFAVAKELSSLTFPIYGNVFPIIILIFCRNSKTIFCKPNNKILDLSNAHHDVISQNYFKFYQDQWNL